VFATLTSIPLIIGTTQELKEKQLWIPKSSDYYEKSKWLETHGLQEEQPPGTHIMIVTKEENGNLLNIKYFKFLLKVHEFIENFTSVSGITFKNECLHSPITATVGRANIAMLKSILGNIPPYPQICEIIEYFLSQRVTTCANMTPLIALTKTNDIDDVREKLNALDGNDTILLQDVNAREKESNRTGRPVTPELRFIGGLSRNNKGEIKAARAMYMAYFFNEKKTPFGLKLTSKNQKYHDYRKELKDALVKNIISTVDNDELDMFVTNGVKQEVHSLLKDDFILLVFGCVLVTLHLISSFSEFNTVDQRIGLAVCGLVSCGLSIVSMNGICHLIGIPSNTLVNLIMIMLVGIGVDDMFVILHTVKSKRSQESAR
jgi:predicted RND superfamily exporter protein